MKEYMKPLVGGTEDHGNTLSRTSGSLRPLIRRVVLSLLVLCLLFPLGRAYCDKKPKVLLLPLRLFAPQEQHAYLEQGLRSMFVSRLSGEGLDLVPIDSISGELTEKDRSGDVSQDRAQELALKAGAGYAIFGSVTTLGGQYSMDLAIVDLTKAPPKLTRVSEATGEDQLIGKVANLAYQFRSIIEGVDYNQFRTAEMDDGGGFMGGEDSPAGIFEPDQSAGTSFKPSGYTKMRMEIVSFDTGDLNGDGIPEIVILGKDRILVANRQGETLVLKSRMNARTGEIFLRVSVGDADRDGQAEIYLVSLYGERAQSSVYKWSGDFHKSFEYEGHLNAVRNSDTARVVLIHQGSSNNRLYVGDISLMEYKGKASIQEKEELPLEGAMLYTLAISDINIDGMDEFIGLDKDATLTVWTSDGTVLWNGEKKLGGSNNAVELGEKPGPESLRPRNELSSRTIVTDLNRDGKKDVVATENIAVFGFLDQLRLYKTSRLHIYACEGSTLTSSWSTREIQYAVADLQKEGATIYVAGVKGKFSNIAAGSSSMMWFE